jgi:hypothetical protein
MLKDENEKKNQFKKELKKLPKSTWVNQPNMWSESWDQNNFIETSQNKS